jgi:membrane associated rhomboid family serine protease
MSRPVRARASSTRLEDRFSFGGRVPWAVGLVMVLTIGLSLLVAFGSRHAGSLFDWVALEPPLVWRGQLWRLGTWTFVESGPIALVFGALFLYWFGSDLANEMGSRRFLQLFGGVTLAAAVGTCLVALVDPDVAAQQYLGGWAASTAMMVAWGFWFPHRVVRIWFVIPIRGIVIAWLTIGITVACAAYLGWETFLPELFCEAGILLYLFGPWLLARVRRPGGASAGWRREAARRERGRRQAASIAYLRVVESLDDDPPPMPGDLEGKVRDILSRRRDLN